MEIVNRIFTQAQFKEYCDKEVAPKMSSAFKPIGVVLHNTDRPKASQWFWDSAHDRTIDSKQRLRNVQHGYEQKGWGSGPHLFIAPKDGILAFSPLWKRGTHSPSWNNTHFAVELVGNYDVEVLSDQIRSDAVWAIACMYKLMKLTPTADNFKFHKEDPRTSHRGCPGKNVGTKDQWISAIKIAMASMAAVAAVTVAPTPVPPPKPATYLTNQYPAINEAALNTIKRWESFRATPYDDVGSPAIGYGHTNRIGTWPTVTPDLVVTEQQAHDILVADLNFIAKKIAPSVRPEIMAKLTPNQWGAMLSFAYNVGSGALLASTLLKKVNAGDFDGAALEFPKWNKARKPKKDAAGNVMKDSAGNTIMERVELLGLTRRRTAEKDLFIS